MTDNKTPAEGVTITILRSGMTVPHDSYSNRVTYRNEVVHLTPAQVEDTKDRNGKSWLDLSDEDQIARWGVVSFRIGNHANGEIGDDDFNGLRYRHWQEEYRYAQKISDPNERKKAMDALGQKYPESREESRTIASWGA